MKESKVIIIVLSLMVIVSLITQMCSSYKEWYYNLITNLEYGAIVGLVTALCQYFSAKKTIINNVYELYFDLYSTYLTIKNKPFMYHYNAANFFKKLIELSPKINKSLGEYHGLFKKKDSMYMKMNPQIKMIEGYKSKNIKKVLFLWFNKKLFSITIEPFIKDIEKILMDIDKKRFEKDKEQMLNMLNFLYN